MWVRFSLGDPDFNGEALNTFTVSPAEEQETSNEKLRGVSDGKPPVMEIWGVWGSPSLTLHTCPHWPAMVAPVCVPAMVDLFQNYSYSKGQCAKCKYEVHTISFQTFFVWALLWIVHT